MKKFTSRALLKRSPFRRAEALISGDTDGTVNCIDCYHLRFVLSSNEYLNDALTKWAEMNPAVLSGEKFLKKKERKLFSRK